MCDDNNIEHRTQSVMVSMLHSSCSHQLILLLGWLFYVTPDTAAQHLIDAGIFDVRMQLILPNTGESHPVTTDQLGAYLYDIGPAPRVRFEVLVDTKKQPATASPKLDLKIERYLLLTSREESAYTHLPNKYPDAAFSEPTWIYSGPVPLSYNRIVRDDTLRFITEPYAIDFLDPENPLTLALPVDFTLPGFAYRFLLQPAALRSRDGHSGDNAFQLTFLKH